MMLHELGGEPPGRIGERVHLEEGKQVAVGKGDLDHVGPGEARVRRHSTRASPATTSSSRNPSTSVETAVGSAVG